MKKLTLVALIAISPLLGQKTKIPKPNRIKITTRSDNKVTITTMWEKYNQKAPTMGNLIKIMNPHTAINLYRIVEKNGFSYPLELLTIKIKEPLPRSYNIGKNDLPRYRKIVINKDNKIEKVPFAQRTFETIEEEEEEEV